jgi:hypothetical protein
MLKGAFSFSPRYSCPSMSAQLGDAQCCSHLYVPPFEVHFKVFKRSHILSTTLTPTHSTVVLFSNHHTVRIHLSSSIPSLPNKPKHSTAPSTHTLPPHNPSTTPAQSSNLASSPPHQHETQRTYPPPPSHPSSSQSDPSPRTSSPRTVSRHMPPILSFACRRSHFEIVSYPLPA